MNTAAPHYFGAPERVALLELAAQAWVGTPYVASGAVRGRGASCHMLAAAVLADAGCSLGAVPDRGATRKVEYAATMRAWLDAQPGLVARIEPTESAAIQAGDILLMHLGIGHIALALERGRMLQVLRNQPAHITTLHDARLRARVRACYRPLDPFAPQGLTPHG